MKLTRKIQLALGGLAVVTVVASAFELYEINSSAQQGSIINKAGIVRGATQRLVKLETNSTPSDALITKIDGFIDGLLNGNKEFDLPPAPDGSEFKNKMLAVETSWGSLRATIQTYRQDPSKQAKLLAESETFFELTNDAVFEAEVRSNEIVNEERLTIVIVAIVQLIVITFVFITLMQATKLLKQSVNSVAGSSTQIKSTVEEQGRIVSEQTASVNETTSTVEELGASSLQAAQQAGSSAAGAQQALDLSENGKRTVQETLDGIANLRTKVADIAEQIMRLSEQTDQISSVSGLVADVADQTNMLALNAAVEAARAGEQGKGFAVVAGEIRKLADQSRSSADKINTLVADIQASINSTVMVTDEGNKTASAGIELAQNTLTVFQDIASAVNEVSLNSQQIALSAKQQAVGVQQAVSAMNAINLGAKETATVVSQVQASTEVLTDVAQKLEVTV